MATRPNIIFIMSDDHAAHAMSCYGSVINTTPSLDRIAQEGVRLDNCFCTNSICTPSRATILTGQYGHVNGVKEWEPLDNRRPVQLQKLLQASGYATAMIGKWHLGHGTTTNVYRENDGDPGAVPSDPAGFDEWCVLPGQGRYIDPEFRTPTGVLQREGYVSDIITDMSLDWLDCRDTSKPFLLCVHHKAPHRSWVPGPRYANLFDDVEIPHPKSFDDTYEGRPAAAAAEMRIAENLNEVDVKGTPPEGLSDTERKNWYYQRYIKDYLRCIASVDESVGRILDYLDQHGLADDTIVAYTSDQGFFLGDHGWYDKRFMYEESLRMPMVVRYPAEVPAGSVADAMVTNTDFAPTFLDYAGVDTPGEMQGVSARRVFAGDSPEGWQESMYYRYWNHGGHGVTSHYGVRTRDHKLVFYYGKPGSPDAKQKDPVIDPYWELYDLAADPLELHNVYSQEEYASITGALMRELELLQQKYRDQPLH